MADESDGVVIKISGNAEDFAKAADQVKQIFGSMGDSGKEGLTKADIAYGEFIGHLAEKGVELAVEGIVTAFEFLTDQIKEAVGVAEKFEDAFNKLSFSLATAGKYTQEGAERFNEFSEALEKTTTVNKALIQSSAAVLESLTGLSEQGLERATQAGLDFAAATGKSLPEAMNLIARAAEGNTAALKRAGIEVESTGNKAKDLENTLHALESRFTGASSAAAQTFSGQVQGVKNSFEDFQGALGEFITKNPAALAALKGIGDFFSSLKDDLETNKTEIRSFIDNGINLLIDSVGTAAHVFNAFLDTINAIEIGFKRVSQTVIEGIEVYYKISAAISGVVSLVEKLQGFNSANADMEKKTAENRAKYAEQTVQDIDTEIEAQKAAGKQREETIDSYAKKLQDSVRDRIEDAKQEQEQTTEALKVGISERRQASDAAGEEAKQKFKEQENTTLNETIRIAGADKAIALQLEVDKLVAQGKYVEAKKKLTEQDRKNEELDIFAIQKYEELSQQQRLANLQSSLGSIASLESSSNQTLFAIGKGAALATATIDGIQAIQKALASAPPPFNFAIAALVGVAQAENLSKIAGASPPTGAAEGGLVTGGAGGSTDDQPFMLAKGELIAPAKNFDEVVNGVARERGLTGGDQDTAKTNELLQKILDQGPGLAVFVKGADGFELIKDPLFINELSKQIREAVQFRGADLGVA